MSLASSHISCVCMQTSLQVKLLTNTTTPYIYLLESFLLDIGTDWTRNGSKHNMCSFIRSHKASSTHVHNHVLILVAYMRPSVHHSSRVLTHSLLYH
jgi:hypothetical protein